MKNIVSSSTVCLINFQKAKFWTQERPELYMNRRFQVKIESRFATFEAPMAWNCHILKIPFLNMKRFLFPWKNFNTSKCVGVMVNIDCQPGGIWNCLGAKYLGLSVSGFLYQVSWDERSPLTRWHNSMGWSPGPRMCCRCDVTRHACLRHLSPWLPP